jgi:hypothetical protein
MEWKETNMARRSINILKKTGVYNDINQIVWDCAIDAFGNQCRDSEFQSYEKYGYIFILHRYFSIDYDSGEFIIEDEKLVKIDHFEDGINSKAFYNFGYNRNLNLKISLKDKYFYNSPGYKFISVNLLFDDFHIISNFKINSYTKN